VIVRRIFDLFIKGYGYQAIASELNNAGITTATGGPFYKSSIYEIITREVYAGIYVYSKRRSSKGKRNNHHFKPLDEQIRIEGGVPAIIEQSIWDKAQSILQSRKRGPQPRKNAKTDYLLTGLIWCGECGSSITGAGYRKRGGHFYACTKRQTKACSCPTISQQVSSKGLLLSKLKVPFLTTQPL